MNEHPSSKSGAGLPNIAFADLVRDKLVLVALAGGKVTADCVRENGARDVLMLDRSGPSVSVREGNHVRKRYSRLADVRKNNCNVALLHGEAVAAVTAKQKFAQFSHVLVPAGLSQVAVAIALLRYGKRKALVRVGKTEIACNGTSRRYVVLEVHLGISDNRRQFGPAGCSPLELLRRLEGLDYVALRWSEKIEAGQHAGDIDILVSQEGLAGLKERFSREVSTYPLDVYTDDGQGGHGYKSVPYFTPGLAKGLLASGTLTQGGIRVASPYWRFLAFCYHLTFHNKSEHVRPGTQEIAADTFHKAHYYPELARLAGLAGKPVPRTYDDIEALLREAGVFPSLDLIGFYSNKNAFLKKRYFDQAPMKVGLATFFIRDFGHGLDPVSELRTRLQEHFEILAEGPVAEANRERVLRGVRGGNWADKKARGGVAYPVYWFVCWDAAPIQPSARTRRKHPRVDNERIRLKDHLRRELTGKGGEVMRVVHSSDNSLEAFDHLDHLGLKEHPAIAARLRTLN